MTDEDEGFDPPDDKDIVEPAVRFTHGVMDFGDGPEPAVGMIVCQPMDEPHDCAAHDDEHERMATLIWPASFAASVAAQLAHEVHRALECEGLPKAIKRFLERGEPL